MALVSRRHRFDQVNDVVIVAPISRHVSFFVRDKAQATVKTQNPFIILVSADFDLLGAQVYGGIAEGLN